MLTNVAVNAFKPAEKPYKKADGGGLFLLVQPNGSKIWRFASALKANRSFFPADLIPRPLYLLHGLGERK